MRGSAFVAKGDIDSANVELNKIQQLSAIQVLDEMVIMTNTGKTLLDLAATGLEGEIAYKEGDFVKAIEIFREAVYKQDQLNYNEPSDWSQSMRLYLGDALFQAGQYEEAELVFKKDLEEFKETGWALFGLWKSLEFQNKTDEAEDVKQRFENAWIDADLELERARL